LRKPKKTIASNWAQFCLFLNFIPEKNYKHLSHFFFYLHIHFDWLIKLAA